MREFSNRATTANGAITARQPEQFLEIAKWPEQAEQVWDISRWDEVQRNEPPLPALPAGEEEPKQERDIVSWGIFDPGNFPSPDIHAQRGDGESQRLDRADGGKESGNMTARIVAGIVMGLLIIGGSIFAYKSASTSSPLLPAMTAKATTPVNSPVAPLSTAPDAAALSSQTSPDGISPTSPPVEAPPATAPETADSPSQTSPTGILPTPSRTANSANTASRRQRSRVADDPINAPMTLTPETALRPHQSARAGRTSFADDPINAPMTLTPETAPPPQQPVAPPAVPGLTSQPVPAR
ncbi:MAG TPA: hypothetical protein VNW15_02850 [Rhizomicrobium sp.]|nr:hypothetical protein [Rhizomicrobium sp.]